MFHNFHEIFNNVVNIESSIRVLCEVQCMYICLTVNVSNLLEVLFNYVLLIRIDIPILRYLIHSIDDLSSVD